MGAFEPIHRFGGEEFVLLLTGSDVASAAEVAERLREAVCATPILGSTVTMSFGVAASTGGEIFEFEDVFRRADNALYEAKHSGRNRVSSNSSAAGSAVELRPPERRQSSGVRGHPIGAGDAWSALPSTSPAGTGRSA